MPGHCSQRPLSCLCPWDGRWGQGGPAGRCPLPHFQVPPALAPKNMGETPPRGLVARTVSPRDSPGLHGVALMVTAPFCPLFQCDPGVSWPARPLSSSRWGPGLGGGGIWDLCSGVGALGSCGRDLSGDRDLRDLVFGPLGPPLWGHQLWEPVLEGVGPLGPPALGTKALGTHP